MDVPDDESFVPFCVFRVSCYLSLSGAWCAIFVEHDFGFLSHERPEPMLVVFLG